jgi:aspartate-semialdehyde dehydrogenase
VGETLLSILEERQFPFANLIPLASERSAGERVKCGARSFTVQELDSFDFKGVDIAFFSAGGKVSRVHAPRAARAGAVVIDNSSSLPLRRRRAAGGVGGQPGSRSRTARGASSPTRTARPCN